VRGAAPEVGDRIAHLVEGSELLRGEEAEGWAIGEKRPSAVVAPGTVGELVAVLTRASEEGWSVAPAGAGRWLGGGGPPERLDLVVSVGRLAGIEEYEPDDLTLTAGAGTPISELRRIAGERGQWLPMDPPGAGEGTLGALVATGLPGPLVTRFGRPRDQLLGVTVVTGDGRVLRPGGRVVKNVAGFDLVRLLAGSWGTLGVVTSASLRLFPLPERDVTLIFRSPDGDGAGRREVVELGRRLATAPVVPAALELLRVAPGGGRDREGGVEAGRELVAVRLLGRAPEVAGERAVLVEAAGRSPDEVRAGDGSRALHDFVEGRVGVGTLELRLALPPDRLELLMEEADLVAEELGARGAEERSRGVHLTTGALRMGFSGLPAGGGPEAWTGEIEAARDRLEEGRGSLSVLRGPDPVVRGVGPPPRPGGVERLEEGLRHTFDPAGVLLPGRRVP